MRLINSQSFPRWIHWFWITGTILYQLPHPLLCQENNSSSISTTTQPAVSTVSGNSNVSVSHTISVVSVLYSSQEALEKTTKSSTTASPESSTTSQGTSSSSSPQSSTAQQQPPSITAKAITIPAATTLSGGNISTSTTATALNVEETTKPLERGEKEGRSLNVHTPVVVSVLDKEVNRSSVEIFSESTLIFREEESSILEIGGEGHGSLLSLRDQSVGKEEPSKEATDAGMSTNMLIGIIIGTLLLMIIGTVGFGVLIYHEKFANKPQTLDDNYANSDSGGIYNFSTTEDFFRRISHIECGGFDIEEIHTARKCTIWTTTPF
eukprot:TRINITY_DN7607_c0_g1_i2.p1 TRINITY_DN7607_c0_g1~~TRINITY_DN7607_c0_g1_i2.p1  ORF type:complete len:323 (-),score=22.17 TRINITY_DN7607_c0_g1_i2:222-1190(-)